MKKHLFIIILLLMSINLLGQSKTSVANSNSDCLGTYTVQYEAFNSQFMSDIGDCGLGMAMDWITGDAASALMNSDCGYEALNRFYTNCDNAANAFAACSGLVITN